ncbi:MAG: hypothetical protein Q8J88_07175, partial [Bacteroidales bacterium]|nr:hypothetical protein [Bacteroidales bacterium]
MPIQTVDSLEVIDTVEAGFAITLIEPEAVILPQPPVNGIEYANTPLADGVPEIVIVFAAQAAVTPAGNPVGAPMPVAPVVVCVIAVKGVLIHKVGVDDATLAVLSGVTV